MLRPIDPFAACARAPDDGWRGRDLPRSGALFFCDAHGRPCRLKFANRPAQRRYCASQRLAPTQQYRDSFTFAYRESLYIHALR
jgi:hypothetical protein